MAHLAYALCAITCAVCWLLLTRAYLKTKVPLLFWSSGCFFFLTSQNILLFADYVLVPTIDLSYWRLGTGTLGSVLLLGGLIWESRA